MASEQDKAAAARFRETHDMSEVRIWSIDAGANHLIDVDGNRFEEVETNIWGRLDQAIRGERRLVYLGTGKHGDRITLRALYAKVDDGRWLNVHTGSPAPFPSERMAAW